MTAKEIREAAKAVLKFTFHETPPDHPFHEIYEVSRKRERLLADYILANVPEDGEEPVTEDWLREEWGWNGVARDKTTTDIGCGFIYGKLVPHEHGCDYYVANMVISQPATRSQFRSLMQGLGIEPKKISQKNINFS